MDSTATSPTAVGTRLRDEIAKVLVGQEAMVTRMLIGLLAGGHLLLEGMPGLAKTLTVRCLAEAIDTGFSRIQFTPDMLPADVIGTEVFNPREGTYSIKRGPVFSNLVLADEINRAPAKVQAALLEVMQESQVTIGGQTLVVDQPFLVLATQNPIEQEGTLPVAGSAGRSVHDEDPGRLSLPRRGAPDPGPDGRRTGGTSGEPDCRARRHRASPGGGGARVRR